MGFFFEHHGMAGSRMFWVNRMRDESFPAHLHRAYELLYVQRGTLSVQVEQNKYLLEQGDLAFVFSNQVHSFSAQGRCDITVVVFSPELIGDFYSTYKNSVPACNVIHPAEQPDFRESASVYGRKSLLYSLCDRLLAVTEMVPAGNRSQVVVLQQIFAYVDGHYGEDCTLKRVAKALQYDYAYLSKLFARHTGIHFTEYLNQYRIAQACYLLGSGEQTVSEVAARCGYTTLRTFHRNFRKEMLCAPREYRTKR